MGPRVGGMKDGFDHCHVPVSYTHLDVYKRQVEKLSTPDAGLPAPLVPRPEAPGAMVTRVTRFRPTMGNSATDVYKRQSPHSLAG